MTSIRWALGALLSLFAFAAAAHAYGVYADHKLWLGAFTIGVLAAMNLVGFLSLAKARARLGRELTGLRANPPSGVLVDERKAALQQIHARNVFPDLDALRLAASAEQTAEAYLGRYFVAVTVLVGLVGTFAGLMETLNSVAPLLNDSNTNAMQLIAAPLAGLDVTFGASIVAILVTLALSLVQGDLVLTEELVLAKLDDVTVHTLMPEIFPGRDRPEQRMAAEVSQLRTELASVVAQMAEQAAQKVSVVAEKHVDVLVKEVRSALAGVVAENAKSNVAEMHAMQAALKDALSGSAAKVHEGQTRLAESTEKLARDFSDAIRSTQERTEQSFRTLLDGQSTRLEQVESRVSEASTRVLDAVTRSEEQAAQLQDKLLNEARNQTKVLTVAMGSAAEKTESSFKTLLTSLADSITSASRESVQSIKLAADETRAANERIVDETRAQAKALLGTLEGTQDKTRDVFRALLDEHAARLQQLTKDVADATVGIADGMETTAKKVGELLEAAADRTASLQEKTLAELAAQTARMTSSQNDSVERTDQALTELARSHAEHMKDAASTLHAAAQEVVKELSGKVSGVSSALDEAMTTTLDTQKQMLEDTRNHLQGLSSSADSAAHATEEALNKLFAEHAQRLEQSTNAVLELVKNTVTTGQSTLQQAGEQLAAAAASLKESTAVLAPSISTLAPELTSLTNQVALLASRVDEPEEQNAVVDELVRLGEGMDRLQGLLRVGHNGNGSAG